MTGNIHFSPPAYEGGRHLLMCGQIEAGAVFPPGPTAKGPAIWRWKLWIGGTHAAVMREGHAKSELAAKNALAAALGDWINRAGLQVRS